MKTTIYYFSGTGNCLAVSKDLARELNDAPDSAIVLPIAKVADQNSIISYSDMIGIVFPVYCHDLPSIVEQFVDRLTVDDTPVFAIATYNLEPGNALLNLDSLLVKKGSRLSWGFNVCMPGNSVLVIDLTTTDEENEKRFVEEKKKIRIIAEALKSKLPSGIEGSCDPDEKYEAKVYLDTIYKVAEHFWITDACDQCEICLKVCPKRNIEINNGRIVWHNDCEHCLACLHWCPKAAIQNGDSSQNCRRYHHPDISLKEIMQQR